MLDKKVIKNILDAALTTSADFSELFLEDTNNLDISMSSNNIEKSGNSQVRGAGIRVAKGYQSVYGYTNNVNEENLIQLAKDLAASFQGESENIKFELEKLKVGEAHHIEIDPRNVSMEEKSNLLVKANKVAREYSDEISQVQIRYMDSSQKIWVANSEGTFITDTRIKTRFTVVAIASNDHDTQTGMTAPGGNYGFEFFKKVENVEEIAKESARIAVAMLHAEECPSGKMPVIMDNKFGGVIFHEACGHSLEATGVAKGMSVFADKKGEKIANELVTAIDDGTIANEWGSATYDDEGNLQEKRVLIKDGILTSYMIDKINGKRMGEEATGSGRRESYKYSPTSRMSNTYIDNGTSTFDEIIAATEYGLYAKTLGGGSVNPASGDFNFAVLEGYIVRNGKISEPVKGATLVGTGSEALLKIDMVGNNLKLAPGMCGSSSGSIPAGVGQPTLRISELTVGGRKEEN
ncbi:MAG: TldD/PmbA family protein [Psychrilyobacter sp.]|nr:TldD/PmbA family protein [Psychrilyobacter sp.]